MKQLLTIILLAVSVPLAAQLAPLQPGTMAPEITLPNSKDSLVNLSSFKGKVVLVDFWASWCGPCRLSNPYVVKLYKKFKANGFEVVGVSIDSKKKDWVKAIKQDGITYTQLNDAAGWESATAASYGVEAIPATFLLDKKGKIVAIDTEEKLLEEKIAALLAEQ
ncbi:MAG: hypothetical protein RL172_2844 [Bacteroidota bacterium]|jgi:peroxiredoxin